MISVFTNEENAGQVRTTSLSGNLIKALYAQHASNAWAPDDIGEFRTPAATYSFYNPSVEVVDQTQHLAADTLEKARAQAGEIIAQAKARAGEVTQQAYEAGLKAADTDTQSTLATAKEIVKQVFAWRDEVLAQSEGSVINLVKTIAQKVFGEGIVLDQNTLESAYNRALEEAQVLGDLRIYVNPQDATVLDSYWREFQVSVSGHQIQIIPSEAIQRGGCFISGQLGAIDARVDTQMKMILETLDSVGAKKEDEA
jgi:flagellar biosynthesis/type III secretory pathway protein FliH